MYCPNCGTKCDEQDLFCRNCGTSLSQYQDIWLQSQEEGPKLFPANNEKKQPKKRKKPIVNINIRDLLDSVDKTKEDEQKKEEKKKKRETEEYVPKPPKEEQKQEKPETIVEKEELPKEQPLGVDEDMELGEEDMDKEVAKILEEPEDREVSLFGDQDGTETDEEVEDLDDIEDWADFDDVEDEDVYDEPEEGNLGVKLHISKKLLIPLGGAAIAVVLLILLMVSIGSKYSPEKSVRGYYEALLGKEWDKVYAYCSFPDDEMLSQQMYEDVHVNDTKRQTYKSLKIEKTGKADSDLATYRVEYWISGETEKRQAEVQVTRGKKKFLFWNEWKVVPSDAWIKDVEFRIPENATLTLNGTSTETGKVGDDGMKTVTLPYLFLGEYQMEVSENGMNAYRDWITVDENGSDKSEVMLAMSGDEKQELIDQFTVDLSELLNLALDDESFGSAEKLFSDGAMKDDSLKEKYEKLAEVFEDSMTTGFTISNIEATVKEAEGNADKLSLLVTMDIEIQYKRSRYGSERTEEKTYESYVDYERDGNEWKLFSFPITNSDLTYTD